MNCKNYLYFRGIYTLMPTKTYLIPKSKLKVFEQGFQRMNELAAIFAAEASEMRIIREFELPVSNEMGNEPVRMVEIEAIIKAIEPDVIRLLDSSAFNTICNMRDKSVEVAAEPQKEIEVQNTSALEIKEIKPSEWQGQVGNMLSLTADVKSMEVIRSQYGETYLYIMTDEQGNIFKWYATQQKLEPGKRYNLRGKVKGHEIYEGVKETLITRVRVK